MISIILDCKGKVIFAGIGKSGLIARKISATFSSVGIPSFFCDPAQALHGDMGQIEKRDILIIFSYSGNTLELTNMLYEKEKIDFEDEKNKLYLIKEKINLMKQDIEKEKDELNQLKIKKIDMDAFFK